MAVGVTNVIPAEPLWIQALAIFSLALASHYLTDLIPHGHYEYDAKKIISRQALPALLDLVGFAALIMLLAWWQYGWSWQLGLIAVGIAGAQATDIWDWVVVARGWVPLKGHVLTHRRLHQWTHWHDHVDASGKRTGRSLAWWDLWQVAVAALAIVILAIGV